MEEKIKISSIISGSATYLVANIINAAIPFVLLPILTRYLSQAEYGEVALIQTLIGALGAFVGLSVQGAANRKNYDSDLSVQEFKYYIGNCLYVLALTTVLVFSCVFTFRYEFSRWFNIKTSWLLIGVISSSAISIIAIRLGQWQIRKNARNFGIFQIVQSLFNMLFSLLLVVYFLNGADGRILVIVITPVIFALIALYFLFRDKILGFAWRPVFLKEIFAFGVPLIPHSVGSLMLSSIDRFVVSDRLGLAQVAVYMVGVQLVSIMNLIFNSINSAYVPWLFEILSKNKMEDKLKVVRMTYVYYLILFFVVGLAFVIGPNLLIFIAGEKYSDAAEIVGWLALGQAFGGMYLMITNYIFFSKRTACLSLTTIVMGVVNVCLMLILIDLMGLKGAAISFAISMGLQFLMTWYFSNKVFPMPWLNFKMKY